LITCPPHDRADNIIMSLITHEEDRLSMTWWYYQLYHEEDRLSMTWWYYQLYHEEDRLSMTWWYSVLLMIELIISSCHC
jgi:hypothetical protein